MRLNRKISKKQRNVIFDNLLAIEKKAEILEMLTKEKGQRYTNVIVEKIEAIRKILK